MYSQANLWHTDSSSSRQQTRCQLDWLNQQQQRLHAAADVQQANLRHATAAAA
jgi:hypothetical protein